MATMEGGYLSALGLGEGRGRGPVSDLSSGTNCCVSDRATNSSPCKALLSGRLRRGIVRTVRRLPTRYERIFVGDEVRGGGGGRVTSRLNVSIGAMGCRLGGTLGVLQRGLRRCLVTLSLFLLVG